MIPPNAVFLHSMTRRTTMTKTTMYIPISLLSFPFSEIQGFKVATLQEIVSNYIKLCSVRPHICPSVLKRGFEPSLSGSTLNRLRGGVAQTLATPIISNFQLEELECEGRLDLCENTD